MRVLITCGPSYEPIDQVRRLTNFSTGTLGATLANHFTERGDRVVCLKGEGSTYAGPLAAERVELFGTNDDLAQILVCLASSEPFDLVLHAAALCDYRVARVVNDAGQSVESAKIPTREGSLQLVLAPAIKILPRLRAWFPRARIIGWKYELVGTREEAFAKARRQIGESATDACVLNGAAYGPGFALCPRGGAPREFPDAPALARGLTEFAASGG